MYNTTSQGMSSPWTLVFCESKQFFLSYRPYTHTNRKMARLPCSYGSCNTHQLNSSLRHTLYTFYQVVAGDQVLSAHLSPYLDPIWLSGWVTKIIRCNPRFAANVILVSSKSVNACVMFILIRHSTCKRSRTFYIRKYNVSIF